MSLLDCGWDLDGRPVLVMEHAAGRTLSSRLADGERLPAADVVLVLRALAEALDHIHAVGLLHRDVKPANVVVSDSLDVKLVDFGLARRAWTLDRSRPGWLEGTPEHMAPEQALGAPLGPATDRWALAALALELLTGHRPYASEVSPGRTLLAIVERAPRRPSELGLGGADVERFFARALAHDPAARPTTSVALVDELGDALRTSFRTEPAVRAAVSQAATFRARAVSLRPAA